MNNLAKRFLAIVLSVTLLCSLGAVALADGTSFSDLPSDYSTAALQAAVANGLLKGTDGKILPNDNLTRAQMAAVIVRAFGATKEASLASFTDVDSGAWYYAELSKAVKMEIINGSGSNIMPNDPVTREQTAAILARALKLTNGTASDIGAFADASKVSTWAVGTTAAMVKAGYLHGANGNLNPTANITRKDFAVMMNNIIKQYISKAGTCGTVVDGNVMINTAGVTLKGVTITGNLIIGDGVGDGDFTLDGSTVNGAVIVRGGGVNSIHIIGNSSVGKVVVAKTDGNVRVAVEGDAKVEVVTIADGKDDVVIEGKVDTVSVQTSDTPVIVQNATVGTVEVKAENADVTVAKTATVTTVTTEAPKTALTVQGTVGTVTATSAATAAKVEVASGAKVTTVNAAAQGTSISGSGTVSNANVTGNSVKVDTTGTKTTVSSTATGTTSNGSNVPSGTTTTTTGGTTTGVGVTGGPAPKTYEVDVKINDDLHVYKSTGVSSSASLVSTILDSLERNKATIKSSFVDNKLAYTTYIYSLGAEALSDYSSQTKWNTYVGKYYNTSFPGASFVFTTRDVPASLTSLSTPVGSLTGNPTFYLDVYAVNPGGNTLETTYTVTISVS